MITFPPIALADLRTIIQTALTPLKLYSANIEELLCATAAQESHMGTYRTQLNGPALGVYQMEPNTHEDIWANYMRYHPMLPITRQADATLVTDDKYATTMARIQYLRDLHPLPDPRDLQALWETYKRVWNTPKGAAQQDQFNANYIKYITNA